MISCLSHEEMAALVDGKLSGERKEEFLAHIATCEQCLDEYLFLTSLHTMDPLANQESPEADGTGKTGGDGLMMGLAGLGAAVIPLFGEMSGHGFHEPKVAGHENNSTSGERNASHDDSNHHGHVNHPEMNDSIHPAERHFGPEASDERSFDVDQHYADTCAIRSQQLILRDYGINLTQEQLIKEAKEHGWYDHGTPQQAIGNLMVAHGLGVNRVGHANEFNLFHELAQGHEIIVAVNSNELWHQGNLESLRYELFGGNADHALIVAGIDTRDEANPMVIVKDPGTGQIAKEYPMDQFITAWKGSDCFMVTTDRPAPPSLPQMVHFNYALGHVEHMGDHSFDALHQEYADHLQPYATEQHNPPIDLGGHHTNEHHGTDHHENDHHYPEQDHHYPGSHDPAEHEEGYDPGAPGLGPDHGNHGLGHGPENHDPEDPGLGYAPGHNDPDL